MEGMSDLVPTWAKLIVGNQPFGNGSRACIGRDCGWQEATLAAVLLLQNFDIRLGDPQYKLQILQM